MATSKRPLGMLVLGAATGALTLTAAAAGKGPIALNVGDKYEIGNSHLSCVNNSVEAFCGLFGINRPNAVIPGTIVARIREDTVALAKRQLPGVGKPPSTAPFTDIWKVTPPQTIDQPFSPGPAVSSFTTQGVVQPNDFFRPMFNTLQSDLIVRFDAAASGAASLFLSKYDYTNNQVYPGTGAAIITETDLRGIQYTGQTPQTVFTAKEPKVAARERAVNLLWRKTAAQVHALNRYRRTPPFVAHAIVRVTSDARLIDKSFTYDDVVDVCTTGFRKLKKDVGSLAKAGPRLPPRIRKNFVPRVGKVQKSLKAFGAACA